MSIVDRRYSVAEGQAVKAPCRVATTANITLSGEQTIDGVAVVEDDRVLVKDQSTGSQNGIYRCSSGTWTRERDFDGAYDVVTGTRVWITSGSVNANTEYVVTTTGTITIDSTSIAFSSYSTLNNAAPGSADYLVKTANANLSAERVATDAAPVSWDFSTAGQAKIVVAAASESAAGIVELGTSAEIIAGSSSHVPTGAGVLAAIAAVSPALPRGYIDGCSIANSTGDATNDWVFATGVCRNSADTQNMTCAAMTKQMDASFSAGTNQGMRSASALSTAPLQSWHLFSIGTSSAYFDYLAHDDVDATSVLPSGYTTFRRIASTYRSSGVNVPLVQTADRFVLKTPVRDVAATLNPGSTAAVRVISVPLGVVVDADVSGFVKHGGSSGFYFLMTQVNHTDVAPDDTNFDVFLDNSIPNGQWLSIRKSLAVNTSGQIRTRQSASASNNALTVFTHGWIDRRGKDA